MGGKKNILSKEPAMKNPILFVLDYCDMQNQAYTRNASRYQRGNQKP
jgi:hypothetical protein